MRGEQLTELLDSYAFTGDKMVKRFQVSQKSVAPRVFKGQELTDVVGVADASSISKAEKAGRIPELPRDNSKQKRRIATIGEVIELQKYFKTSPQRHEEEEAVTIAYTNFKGGCWKTTTCLHMATYLANQGYRVLAVDLDPQASLTEALGLLPSIEIIEDHTLAPYISELDGFPQDFVDQVITDTYLPNLKVIPSCLDLAHTEYDLNREVADATHAGDHLRQLHWFTRVRDIISGIKQDYDIVLLDGTPALGLLPLNIVMAADVVIVPVPTEATDFSSTITFTKLLNQELSTLHQVFGEELEFPELAFLPTRYSSSGKATTGSDNVLKAIRATFGNQCLLSYIKKHEAVVSNLALIRRTVFDVNPGVIDTKHGPVDIKKKARENAIDNFTAAFDEIMERLVWPRWASKADILATRGR